MCALAQRFHYSTISCMWEWVAGFVISDADGGNTNVLCCSKQPPEASGAAPRSWGGRQQGTVLYNVVMYTVEQHISSYSMWIALLFLEVM